MVGASVNKKYAPDAYRLFSRLLILVNDCNTGEQSHLPAKYAWRFLGISQLEKMITMIGMYFAMDPDEKNMALLLNTMADCEYSTKDVWGFTEAVLDEHGQEALEVLTKAGGEECKRLNELAAKNK